ncbi:MAG: GAF domain-containing protein [Spirochaetes bacterium]|nr:GAF domain-containing protein [Spirochaetota bacterium]
MKFKNAVVRIAAPASAVMMMLFCIAVLMSWITGTSMQLRLLSNSTPMPPVAAICGLLTSFAILLLQSRKTAFRVAASVCAGTAGLVAFTLLGVWLAHIPVDIENLIVAVPDVFLGVKIGRMSPIGMVFFILADAALVLTGLFPAERRIRQIGDTIGMVILVAVSVILTGYWYGAPLLYGGTFIPVPFASALMFFALAAALLFIMPDALFSRLITGTSVFASFMRYVVPAITVVIMVSGWFVLTFGAGLVRENRVIIDSLVAIISVAILTAVSFAVSRRAGRKLQESEARLSATLRSIGDGVIATDASGNVISLNNVAETLTGWKTRDAFGRGLSEIFNIVNAQTRRPAANPVFRVLTEGIIVGLANHTALIARDGTERQIADSAAPIRSERGDIIGTVLVFRDVTDEYHMQESVTKSEEQYRHLFSEMRAGFALHEIICDVDGTPTDYRFLAVNDAFERMTGLKRADIIGKTVREVMPATEAVWIERYGRVALTGEPIQFEDFSGALDRYYDVRAYSPKRGTFAVIFNDITSLKQNEREREATISMLKLINARNGKHELIQAVTMYLKEWSGCEAVGVRLKEGDDYPYFETRGFPSEFVKCESSLCTPDINGQLTRDSAGNPVLDCMCGNVLQERFDPSKNFFTTRGSFWSNGTTELLATTTDAERQARTRNRCNGEGYESVALVALRNGGETIGLIQINDHRKNRFTAEFIGMLERMADSLAVALTQRSVEKALRESEAMLQCLWNISQYRAKDMQDLLDFTLNESLALTGSTIGYIYHYSEEKKEFTLNTWSREVMKECAVMNPQTLYQLEKTGIWGEVVRQRKAIVVNDFDAPHPQKRGYPEGHVKLSNFLTVPVLSGEHIVAVAGMGNKKGGYTHADVKTLTHLMDSAWKIVERYDALESLRKHEVALMQTEKLKSLGVLATGIAHELNQPLMALSMALDLMLLKPGDSAFAAGKIESMKGYISRITKIVEQVRTFAREQHEDAGGSFSVNDAVTNVLSMIGAQFGNSNVRIAESLDESLPRSRGNLFRMEQVVLNLLSNAKDAIQERMESERGHSGEIMIRTSCADGMVRMNIRDNGCGMSDEVKRSLFTPFFTTKPEGFGTGLGLSIAYGIVKSMGGDIHIISRPQQFTEFTVTLPAGV